MYVLYIAIYICILSHRSLAQTSISQRHRKFIRLLTSSHDRRNMLLSITFYTYHLIEISVNEGEQTFYRQLAESTREKRGRSLRVVLKPTENKFWYSKGLPFKVNLIRIFKKSFERLKQPIYVPLIIYIKLWKIL